MPLSDAQREQAERRIRAAIDRLLAGQIPPGGGCDAKTLALEAGISRASLYRTYPHLKEEFERRRDAALVGGGHPDRREQQIGRLREHNTRLTAKLAQAAVELREERAARQQALSALAAADDAIQRLRRQLDAARRHVLRDGVRAPLAAVPALRAVPEAGKADLRRTGEGQCPPA